MKKIMNFVAALAVVLPVSCNKEMTMPQGDTLVGKNVKVTMNATINDPATKLLLDNNVFRWEVGDEVTLRWANQTYTSTTDGESLTATGSGSAVTFEGEFSQFPKKSGDASKIENLYAYYANAAEYINKSNVVLCKSISQTQTGKLEDIKDHVIYEAYLSYNDIEATVNEEGDYVSASFNANMRPIFSLIKMTIPAELNLTSVTLSTSANIAGLIAVNPSKTSSTAIGSGNAQLVNRSTNLSSWTAELSKEFYQSITVSQDGEVLSGDIYFTIVPDAYDKTVGAYCCSATSLKFIFASETDSFEYTRNLNEKIYMGDLKNLGAVPANIMLPKVEAGTLCLTDATTLTVGVANPNAGCKYYYEIGTSSEDCATPTTASSEFDPTTGFTPAVSGTFDRYFIKVLAHTEGAGYKDAMMVASLRNWKFNENSPVAAILASANSGESLTKVGDNGMTSDGLEVRRNLATIDLEYEQNTARIAINTARMQINAITEYPSDAWIAFYIDKNTCVGVNGKRGYRYFYNNSQSTSDYWAETIKSTMTEENKKNEKHTICHYLNEIFGSVKAGDKFGLRGDGQHVFYGMAMLEVL